MLVMPLSHNSQNRLANDINTILSKIRRGCALARQESQLNPAVNMMVDLPEGIDFEINAIWSYQNQSYGRQITTDNSLSSVESGLDNDSQFEGTSRNQSTSEEESDVGSDISSNSNVLSRSFNSADVGTTEDIGTSGSSSSASSQGFSSGSSSKSDQESSSQSKSSSQDKSQSSEERGRRTQAAGNGRKLRSFEDETGQAGEELSFGSLELPGGGTGCSQI